MKKYFFDYVGHDGKTYEGMIQKNQYGWKTYYYDGSEWIDCEEEPSDSEKWHIENFWANEE